MQKYNLETWPSHSIKNKDSRWFKTGCLGTKMEEVRELGKTTYELNDL